MAADDNEAALTGYLRSRSEAACVVLVEDQGLGPLYGEPRRFRGEVRSHDASRRPCGRPWCVFARDSCRGATSFG